MKRNTTNSKLLKDIRKAVADYMSSEGCGCCSNRDKHEKHEKILAELLNVPKYNDDSGYNFNKFRTEK